MSKQMIKVLGILLAVSFLMSTTAAAWSAESCAGEKGCMQEKMLGKMPAEKGLSKGKHVFIKNLVIAKNIVIIKARDIKVVLNLMLHKGMMKKGMMKKGMMGGMMSGMMGKPCAKGC